METLSESTAGLAWVTAIKKVLKEGKDVYDDGKKLRELLDLYIIIENPVVEDALVKKYGSQEMIVWMKKNFLEQEPLPQWGYSYGSRIQNFSGTNQLSMCIQKLITKPEAKSITLSFMNPSEDKKHTPCIVCLDMKCRDGVLNGTAFFRSQDVGKKLYADILALGSILQECAQQSQKKLGSLRLFIASAHLYYDDILALKEKLSSEGI